MTTIAVLEKQQNEILEIASVVQSLLNKEQLAIQAIAKVTHILLCDLCEHVTDHLAEEHKGVYPSLLSSKDAKTQNLAWGLINNDKILKPEFNKYKKRWLNDCKFDFTDAFIKDTKYVIDTITKRLDIEYHTMIPKIEHEHLLEKDVIH